MLNFSGVFMAPRWRPLFTEEKARDEPILPMALIVGPIPLAAPTPLPNERAPAF